jgi:hypothetical protein
MICGEFTMNVAALIEPQHMGRWMETRKEGHCKWMPTCEWARGRAKKN